jgi:hypothetical protein
MNHLSQGRVFTSIGKCIALILVAVVLSSVLPLAQIVSAQSVRDREVRATVAASAAADVPLPDKFPFGYGGGPASDVVPPRIKDMLANLRARLQIFIFGIFGTN